MPAEYLVPFVIPAHLLGYIHIVRHMLSSIQMLMQQVAVDLPELGLGLVDAQPFQNGCRKLGICSLTRLQLLLYAGLGLLQLCVSFPCVHARWSEAGCVSERINATQALSSTQFSCRQALQVRTSLRQAVLSQIGRPFLVSADVSNTCVQ